MGIYTGSVFLLLVRVVALLDDLLEHVLLHAEPRHTLPVVVVVVLVVLEVVVDLVYSWQVDLYFVLVVVVVLLVALLRMDGFVGAALPVVLFLGQLVDENVFVLLVGPQGDVVLNWLLSSLSILILIVIDVLDLYLLVIALLEGDMLVSVVLFDR